MRNSFFFSLRNLYRLLQSATQNAIKKLGPGHFPFPCSALLSPFATCQLNWWSLTNAIPIWVRRYLVWKRKIQIPICCVSATNNWHKHGQTCTSEHPSEIWAPAASPSPYPNSSSRIPLRMLLTCISTFFICLDAPRLHSNQLFSVV